MIKGVPVFWHKSKNFGDALNPYLVEKISGLPAIFTNHDDQIKYMVVGSILNTPEITSCIVWGAGTAWTDTHFKKPLEIRAVRGPLSREIFLKFGIDCPEVYGDPALLLPKFYNKIMPVKHRIGIVPHVVDFIDVSSRIYDLPIINLYKPIEMVIDEIRSCEMIITSSLHGLIAAHAYGIPALWVKFSDLVIGDGTKFKDYLMSVGHETYEPLDLRKEIPSSQILINAVPLETRLKIDLDALWNSCPFRE
jgi:pyruvyltransferase